MMKKGIDFKRRKWILIGVGICVAVCAALLFTPIFNVENVVCQGNVRIAYEEIESAAKVEKGKNVLLQNMGDIEKRVKEIPLVEDAQIRRIFPDGIKISIKECVPAAYIQIGDGRAVLTDMDGKALEILDKESADKLAETNVPVKVEKYKEKKQEEKKEGEPTPSETPKPTQTPKPTETPKPTDENGEEIQEENETEYEFPLVVGIGLKNPEVGKEIKSDEKEKLKTLMELFNHMENTELLTRCSYIDITDINDVTIVIEKRLEILIGKPENLEYRMSFLEKIINEKISSTEKAVMDYRGNDIYVRSPEDGKARMVPKPSPTPEPTATINPDGDTAEKPSSSPKPTQTPKPVTSDKPEN